MPPSKRRTRRRSDGRESKWDVFDRFVAGLNDVDSVALREAAESDDVGKKRKILKSAGLAEAADVDAAYLVSAIDKVIESREDEAHVNQPVKWTDLLSYGGNGRYLICYMHVSSRDGWVVKMPNSYSSLRYIDLYALSGTKLAQERLGQGEAPISIIIDARKNGRPFIFYIEERGRVETEVAIVQERVTPFIDYLKRICRKGCSSEDIGQAVVYIEKLKGLIISMYAQGVIDGDNFNIAGNYGIMPDDRIAIFDLGDLTAEPSDAAEFIRNLRNFNELMEEGLSEVDGVTIDARIAEFFSKNALRQEDFQRNGENLFGTRFNQEKSRMIFPYTEEQLRTIYSAPKRHRK